MATSPEFYLTLRLDDGAMERLSAVLQTHPIACVRLSTRDAANRQSDYNAAIRDLVLVAHGHGTPLIVDDDLALCSAVGADGVHISTDRALASDDAIPSIETKVAHARQQLGGDAIVGVSAGALRHEAMQIGEAGASYLMFETRLSHDDLPPDDRVGTDMSQPLWLERLAWWNEVFEVPAVAGYIETPEQARLASASGAEFIELWLPHALSAADTVDWVGALRQATMDETAGV